MSDSFFSFFNGTRGGNDYSDKVLSIARPNLVAYWPLSEKTGTNADNLEGTAARDGTYANDVATMGTSAGIGDGRTAPVFTAASGDFVDIYSVSLNAAFDGTEGTVSFWHRVIDEAGWDGGSFWRVFKIGVDDSTNAIRLVGDSTASDLDFQYIADSAAENQQSAGNSQLTWTHYAITWSDTGDLVVYYQAGASLGSDTTISTWSGDLATTDCVIGARTTTPTNAMTGEVAHFALWDAPLTLAQIVTLSIV